MRHLGTVTIETERLILRAFEREDADAMFKNWASDPRVTRCLTWAPHKDKGVTRRVLAYTDGLMCVENTFVKGAVGALHHHPHTQITYVVSGAFAFTVDGVTRTVHAGDTILKEDGVEHGCTCTEAGILLDIFTPMREDFV